MSEETEANVASSIATIEKIRIIYVIFNSLLDLGVFCFDTVNEACVVQQQFRFRGGVLLP